MITQFTDHSGILIGMGVFFRPHLMRFLREISKHFMVVVFTASDQRYADCILDYIDKGKNLINMRLYRQHCLSSREQGFIKDLSII